MKRIPITNCPHCGKSLADAGGWTGEDLRKIREDCGIGLREMSRLTGASAPYLGLIETGERAVPIWAPDMYRSVIAGRAEKLRERADQLDAFLAHPLKSDAETYTGGPK